MATHGRAALAIAIVHIVGNRSKPEMCWIHTRRVVAVMKDLQAIWDWAFPPLVTQPVGAKDLPLPTHATIALSLPLSLPRPTHVWIKIGGKALFQRSPWRGVQVNSRNPTIIFFEDLMNTLA